MTYTKEKTSLRKKGLISTLIGLLVPGIVFAGGGGGLLKALIVTVAIIAIAAFAPVALPSVMTPAGYAGFGFETLGGLTALTSVETLAGAVAVNAFTTDAVLCATGVICGGGSSGGGGGSQSVSPGTAIRPSDSSCTADGCSCYGPRNSCGQAYQGTLVTPSDLNMLTSSQCIADGINLTSYGPPPESGCSSPTTAVPTTSGGACGPASGVPVASAPTSDLCSTGSPSSVSEVCYGYDGSDEYWGNCSSFEIIDERQYQWTCGGTSCQAPYSDTTACTAPLTQTVTVACDLNSIGEAAISGSVLRSQTKSAAPACSFPTPVTASNSTYVSDTCVYPTPTPFCDNGANDPPACNQCPDGQAFIGQACGPCANGGCSSGPGGGGTPYNPTGSLVCNNGANNPYQCNTYTPTATLSANPRTVDVGQSTTLTWSSTNADSCSGGGFSTGGTTQSPSGGISSGALNIPGIIPFQITCTGPGGSTSASATVEVLQPLVTISANPTRVQKDSSSQISWSASGISSCSVSGPSGVLASGPADDDYAFSTGSPRSISITTQSVFTITCETNGAPVSDSAIVNVVPIYEEF